MSSNVAENRFNAFEKGGVNIPQERSRFNLSHRRLDTFNYGELIPIYVEDVMPGDTINITQSSLLRLTTLTKPLMDNLVYDTYYFYIPYRLLQENNKDLFKNLFGEKTDNFDTNTDYQESVYFKNATLTPKKGGLVEKLGGIIGKKTKINTAYINAYKKVYNSFFRDEDIQAPELYEDTILTNQDNEVNKVYTENDNENSARNARILHANKFKDYFTTAKQYAQQGAAARFTFLSEKLEKKYQLHKGSETNYVNVNRNSTSSLPISSGRVVSMIYDRSIPGNEHWVTGTYSTTANVIKDEELLSVETPIITDNEIKIELMPEDFNSIDINEFRATLALQNFKENNLRLGNRYDEKLQWYWDVSIQNDLLDEPEYIGGMRSSIAIQQVAQTSETTDKTPQANLAAYSQTNDMKEITTKTCKEYGIILGIGVLRLNGHTYTQGMRKQLTKENYRSLVWKEFTNLGLQPVKNKEIYVSGNDETDEKTFGYQEIYNEWRYRSNEAHGEFTQTDNSNFNYALSDYYTSTPILRSEFLEERPEQLDRVLVIPHNNLDQVTADFYFNVYVDRQLPTYSVPSKLF